MNKRFLMIVALLCPIALMGCALGAGTAGYSLASKSSDELGANARRSIIDEAFLKAKDYADANFERKK